MLQAGNPGADPTDVFVTTAFRVLLEQVKEHADVVLALLPPMNDETTEMVRQRLDGVLAVCQRGKARVKDLRDTPEGEPGRLIGVVLLTKWRRPGLLRRFTSKSSILLTDLVDAGRADVGLLNRRKAVRVQAAQGSSNNGVKPSSNGFAGADKAVKIERPGKR